MAVQALSPLVKDADELTSEQISKLLNSPELLLAVSLGQVTFGKVGYLRISKDRGNEKGRGGAGLGVARQHDAIIAREPGIEFWLVDNDTSAWSGIDRPDYERLCTWIRDGVIRPDGVVWALHNDRLHRNSVEAALFAELCYCPRLHARDVSVQTINTGPMDFHTPTGRMRARDDASRNQWYSDEISKKVQDKRQQKAEMGLPWSGMRRFGTKVGGIEQEPAEAEAIRDGAKMILAGYSLSDVARDWNARGFRSTKAGNRFTIHNVRNTLTRHHTAGLIEHRGKIYPGDREVWTPILDEQTWASVRAILLDPKREAFQRGSQRIVWLGTGLYKCGVCGDRMFVAGDQYRCKAKRPEREPDGRRHVMRMAKRFDEMIEHILLAALRSETLGADIAARFAPDVDAAGLLARKAELETQIDEYRGLVGQKGWGPKEIGMAVSKLTDEIEEIDRKLTPTLMPSTVAEIASPALTDEEWARVTIERRRALLSELVTVTVLPAPAHKYAKARDYIHLEWAS